MKRWISLLLAVCVLAGMLAVPVCAATKVETNEADALNSLGLFRLRLCGGRAADVYSSLESRVIALPRLPLPCTVLLFILCLLLCGRLCRALQQAEK